MNNIIGLLSADSHGSILNCRFGPSIRHLGYTPYGTDSSSADIPRSKFNGQYQDRVFRCYMLGNGHRAYSCTLMRFLSSDGLSPFGAGGMNAYAYCEGDPVNFHDISGRSRSFFSWFRKRIEFDGDYQVLYPGNTDRAPSVFHKEVFKTGNAGFVTHGSAGKGPLLMNEKGKLVPAKEVARNEIAPRLRGLRPYRDDPNKPVYLIACLAGSSGAAEQVAKVLGRPVIAYAQITSPPKMDFINLQPESHPSLGMKELPPIPYAERVAEPLTFLPGAARRVRN